MGDKQQVKRQKGQVATEWTMITFMMVLVLFTPAFGENQSIMGLLMDSIRGFYDNASLLYSLP